MDFTELLGTPETEPCVDIVTVHGLTRAGKQPWQDTDKRPKWLELELFETSNVRVIIFNYEENGSVGFPVYTQRGIEMTAQMLLERIASWRKSDVECHRPLAFISHDFGGTIVKQAMVFASMNPEKYESLLQSTYSLVFINCPHRPEDHRTLSNSLASLIRNISLPPSDVLEIATTAAWTIIRSNDEFIDTTVLLQARVASVYSEHPDFAERIFDCATATLGVPCETRIPLSGTYAKLLCGENSRACYGVLRETLGISSPDYTVSIWPVSETLEGFRFLQSIATPQRLSQCKAQHDSTQLLQFDDFFKWTQQSKGSHNARCILTSRDFPVLFQHFDTLLKLWNEDSSRPKAVMFTYDPLDSRGIVGSISDKDTGILLVLATLLVQAIAYILPRSKPLDRPEHVCNKG